VFSKRYLSLELIHYTNLLIDITITSHCSYFLPVGYCQPNPGTYICPGLPPEGVLLDGLSCCFQQIFFMVQQINAANGGVVPHVLLYFNRDGLPYLSFAEFWNTFAFLFSLRITSMNKLIKHL